MRRLLLTRFIKAGVAALAGLAAAGAQTATSGPAFPGSHTLVLTSTNGATNEIVVFKLNTGATAVPTLTMTSMIPTGGAGGASGNAGAVQFRSGLGAVANYGSNNVSRLARFGDTISVDGTIGLAANCTHPDSVALTANELFVAGANCAESHAWPWGSVDGSVVPLANGAAQIAVGQTWAAVTSTAGTVVQLPLNGYGALNGTSEAIALPADANNTPLGAAFWGNLLGFNPAHSPDSLALVDASRTVVPILGPQPSYPTNAPCWIVKGTGNLWYTGNSPGKAVSIFFSDDQGGEFYKSVPLPGAPTDITMSPDGAWLAVIYSAADGGHVAVLSVDAYGGLSLAAVSEAIAGVSSFNGVAISQ